MQISLHLSDNRCSFKWQSTVRETFFSQAVALSLSSRHEALAFYSFGFVTLHVTLFVNTIDWDLIVENDIKSFMVCSGCPEVRSKVWTNAPYVIFPVLPRACGAVVFWENLLKSLYSCSVAFSFAVKATHAPNLIVLNLFTVCSVDDLNWRWRILNLCQVLLLPQKVCHG